ncbi:alpha/beta hydrolase [Acuticoccus mangrovi]|uniref:Alpha/beta hydrolase n=1 Tax=Acuticoccus mangrovi TaxID=2796142 RepID=A0A934IN19_9HYPH|nr:alpha/beta hydrolase [Acuticoccus mangrovi]MBJ3777931.1 alpha/beta hydrolase [Acuticoccus mangrovi]
METPTDRAYENSAYIPDADAFTHRWAAAARAFRADARRRLDVAYGLGPRERYDLFLPEGAPRGLVAFIHGGYWMAFDKSSWSHLAAGPLAHGLAVMVPSYPLCPQVRVGAIVTAVGAAIDHAAETVAGPIVVCGHSAGGHLAARMGCRDAPLTEGVAARVARIVSVSGIHDLRPLLTTRMNETLGLDLAEARRESPVLADPADVDLVTWVGDGERPQLRRQSRLLSMIWEGLARSVRHVEAPDRHHFDVVEDLADPASALTRALL